MLHIIGSILTCSCPSNMIGGKADINVSISSMVMPDDNRAKSNNRLVMQQRLQAVRVSSAEHSSSASVTIIICLK